MREPHVRRRRLAAAAAVAIVIAIGAAIVAGSGGSAPMYVPSGGAASVIQPQPPKHHPHFVKAGPFRPAAAVIARAAGLPLERQVSQLFLVTLPGKDVSAVQAIGSLDWGGVVFTSQNFDTDGQIGALAADVASAARSAGHLPPLLAVVQDGGPGSAIPDLPPEPEPVVGSLKAPAAAAAQALTAARRLKDLNFRMTLAPLADVDTPGGPLSGRLFSTDPRTVARFSAAALNGYRQAGVIAAPAHFPGSGAASADPDQAPATVGGSLDELRTRDLIPFARIAPKAPVIVMSNASYAAFDGVTPASLLGQAVDLLRDRYGFGGAVMSGDLDATLQATGQSIGAVALQALQAGDDLLFLSGPPDEQRQAYDAVLAAARASGRVRNLVRDALFRDLTLKASYGVM